MRETIAGVTAIARGRVPQDIEPCIELWVEALRYRDGLFDSEPVAERMRRLFDGSLIRFALSGAPVAGFALATRKPGDGETALLQRIAVRPTLSGHGIGRALLLDALHASKDAGCVVMELGVRRGNPAARLYEAEGFRSVSDPIPHPLGGEPMITYRRDL